MNASKETTQAETSDAVVATSPNLNSSVTDLLTKHEENSEGETPDTNGVKTKKIDASDVQIPMDPVKTDMAMSISIPHDGIIADNLKKKKKKEEKPSKHGKNPVRTGLRFTRANKDA